MNTPNPHLKTKIQNLPHVPGIYKFKNSQGKIIYIGKAKNLRHRVGSYFLSSIDPLSKTGQLVAQIHSVEVIEVKSEVEALILEAHLIGKNKPFYNIVLKDDKSFLYIEILQEKLEIKGKKVLLPRLKVSRKGDLKTDSLVFGPFPSSSATRFVLRTLRKYFPYRDCLPSKFKNYSNKKRPCLYGDLGLCSAPCTEKISPPKYRQQILKIRDFLNGKSSKIISSLESQMLVASKTQKYEDAREFRDMLQKFNYVREKRIPADLYAQKPDLVQDLAYMALEQLQVALPNLETLPSRIECYDISNLGAEDAVGSMVVSVDGKLQKSLYRRFKIKTQNLPDDSSRMAEVLFRRLRRGLEAQNSADSAEKADKNWNLPDLLVMDGGAPQLSVVLQVLEKMNLNHIPVVGLTKKEEILVYFDGEKYAQVKMSKESEGLKLLIRLRDESHRFAQDYHHKLRLKRIA